MVLTNPKRTRLVKDSNRFDNHPDQIENAYQIVTAASIRDLNYAE